MINSYKDAGVDIERGDRFAEFIGNIKSRAVSSAIGGFAGGVEIDTSKYKKPILFSCTDGVGTKLLVAQKMNKFDTVGIDLVAMSVNDLIVCGVEPVSFLDYIACGSLNESVLKDVIKGIVDGCEQAECILAGGETAEMPDLYKGEDFDLAGFCVGLGEKGEVLPKSDLIKQGDVVLGIASSGIHSNGLSLARKVLKDADESLWNLLLTPTRIYVKEFKVLLKNGQISAAAHITGGGLESNFSRVLPDNLSVNYSWDWDVPEIFKKIQQIGDVKVAEMRKVFNMGIGIAMAVSKESSVEIINLAKSNGFELVKIGEVVNK